MRADATPRELEGVDAVRCPSLTSGQWNIFGNTVFIQREGMRAKRSFRRLHLDTRFRPNTNT